MHNALGGKNNILAIENERKDIYKNISFLPKHWASQHTQYSLILYFFTLIFGSKQKTTFATNTFLRQNVYITKYQIFSVPWRK